MSESEGTEQQPSGWKLPEGYLEDHDVAPYENLVEHDSDYLPSSTKFYYTHLMIACSNALEHNVASPREIRIGLNDQIESDEILYPQATDFWNAVREYGINVLTQKGNSFEEALELAFSIKSPRFAVNLVQQMDRFPGSNLTSRINERVNTLEQPQKNNFIRALRDWYIFNEPDDQTVAAYNEYLLLEGVETDSVDGWIESQRIEIPDGEWERVATFAKAEHLWGGLPMTTRQHILMKDLLVKKGIEDGRYMEDSSSLLSYISDFLVPLQDAMPGVTVFGHLEYTLSAKLFNKRMYAESYLAADAIKDSELAAKLALGYISIQGDLFALEVATRNPNSRKVAELLLMHRWNDQDLASRRFSDIIRGNGDYELGLRIGCLEFILEAFAGKPGAEEAIAEYEELLDELRKTEQ